MLSVHYNIVNSTLLFTDFRTFSSYMIVTIPTEQQLPISPTLLNTFLKNQYFFMKW